MPMPRSLALSLALVPLLAACVAESAPQRPTSAPRPTVSSATVPVQREAPPPTRPQVQPSSTPGFRAPQIMNLRGVEGLIGATAPRLVQQFGQPRLDVYEGDARKLQFSGEACVLDVYLYPTSPGAEPTATYVDARRASDGLDVDRAACIKALLGG
ncbi:hypothetical protein [Parerythrobacter lacustris]|uniref:Lipoprotein n=1 Tax=Parerythrobacter lacustris TaxID=2969984 RepID=A0ABT1XNW0_9SPHN|nr:hypothetical protein [Parerythrobacter lacustris]MCR2832335.1 hypothetical protein [Parerythrobacter lacustris]